MTPPSASLMMIANTAFGRDRPLGYWLDAAGVLVLMALAVGVSLVDGRGPGPGIAAMMLTVSCVAYMWFRWVSGALLQNTPANAQLVPGLNRRIRQASLLVWCLCMAPLALIAPRLPFGASLLLIAYMAVTVCGALLARSPSNVHIVVPGLTLIGSMYALESPAALAFLSSPLVVAALLLLCVCCALYTVRSVFPVGGDQHLRFAAMQHIVRPVDGIEGNDRLVRSSGRRQYWYAWMLRRDLAGSAPSGSLMLHALGQPGNLLSFVPMLVLKFGMAGLTSFAMYSGRLQHDIGTLALCLYVIFTQPGWWARLSAAMATTGAEQALVRLSPAAPRLADFNRVIAKRILTSRLLEWGLDTLMLCALVALVGPRIEYILMALSLMACTLPHAVFGLRDFSVLPEPGLASSALRIIEFFCPFVYGGVLILFVDNPQRWSALMLVLLAGSAALAMHRWRIMVAAPPAFPAGRAA